MTQPSAPAPHWERSNDPRHASLAVAELRLGHLRLGRRGAEVLTDAELRYMKYRMRILPEQLELARRKVQHLEREAERLGLHELLKEKK